MKKIRLFIFIGLTLCCQVLFAATRTVHFATEATYPPFEYVSESGQIKGFDIDIANALCHQMKATCTFTNQAFSSLIPSLQLGKFDALIAAIGVTPEREKQVAFTGAYYEPSASFVSAADKHYTIANMVGKNIGVQAGTTFENYLMEKYKSTVGIKRYASIQDAFLDLISERVDAVLTDTPIAFAWLKQNNNAKSYAIVGKPIIDHTFFGTGYAIAVRKNDAALLHSLNQALAIIKKDGTYQNIVNQYFGR